MDESGLLALQRPAPARAPLPRNLLALDLATKTGWALVDREGHVIGGTQSFAMRNSWDPGQRGLWFKRWLLDTIAHHHVHAIAYEKVQRHMGTDAAHLFGAWEMLLWMCASSYQAPVIGVGVGVVKKSWTGAGNAKKDAMVAEAKRRGFRVSDDNHADALGILDWLVGQETDGALQLVGGGLAPRAAAAVIVPAPRAPKANKRASSAQLELA